MADHPLKSAIDHSLGRPLQTKKMYCTKPEGRPLCDWTVIDAGHVLVHIFRNEIREVYDLEKLWSEDFSTVNSAS